MINIRNLRIRLQGSIYSRVVFAILILALFLFASLGFIYRSVNETYLTSVINHCGTNIGSIVEGALYHSMLTNNRGELENTLDVINTLPGIEDVNMYDSQNNLVYSAFPIGEEGHNNPDCKQCHSDLTSMFPEMEKSLQVVNLDSKCEMSSKDYSNRLLLVRSPILNQSSCFTAACHAHQESETVLGSFVIRIPLEDLDNSVSKSTNQFYLFATISTLIFTIFLLLFTRKKIKNPLSMIVRASEAVSRGDKSSRLNLGDTELRDMKKVSHAFNEMLDSLQSVNEELENWSHQLEYKVKKKSEEISEMHSELIHVEKIASLGKLSSSVAHEINNPLSGVLTYTKLVHKQLDKTDLKESLKEPMLKYLRVIEDETKRCGDIVKSLLDFSRKDQLDFKTANLHKVLKEACVLMDHQMKISSIDFYTDFAASKVMISCSENQIKQACIAILLNSSESVTESGEIQMKTSNPSDDIVQIDIIDNGHGIAPEDIPHIFEPFFSAKEKASGIGLGLSIVHGIVQSHKGKIDVESEPGKGTSVSIFLPLIKKQ